MPASRCSIFHKATGALLATTVNFGLFAAAAAAVEIPAEFYGKVNISRDNPDPGADDWSSNASRLGLKGTYKLNESLSVIYQVEQEVDYAHGNKNIDTLFGVRNSYIGLKGSFGKVFFGAHDTPTKLAQNKVDLFDNQVGDIKALLAGEVRARDTWTWHSPEFAGGVSIKAAYVPSDSVFGASKSLSLGYETGDIYAGFAIDQDMRKNEREVARTRVYDSYRGVLQYTPGNWKLGAILQSSEQTNRVGAGRETGYTVSAGYTIDKLTLMGQYGASDILEAGADNLLLGAAYKLNGSTRVYLYYWDLDTGAGSRETLSLGFDYKF